MAKMVGLTRALKYEWLNKTVQLILDGKPEDEIRSELNEYLSYEISSPTNIRKTREILMNIWVYSDEIISDIRKDALSICSNCKESIMPLHWCMILLKYPVFADICALIGKLTSIQDTFSTAWLKEKMFDIWGERTTIFHSSDKILQTLTYLDAIERQSTGIYKMKQHAIYDKGIIRILVKTVLALKQKAYYELTDLSSSPHLFPFVFDVTYEWLHETNYFTLTTFGGKLVLAE